MKFLINATVALSLSGQAFAKSPIKNPRPVPERFVAETDDQGNTRCFFEKYQVNDNKQQKCLAKLQKFQDICDAQAKKRYQFFCDQISDLQVECDSITPRVVDKEREMPCCRLSNGDVIKYRPDKFFCTADGLAKKPKDPCPAGFKTIPAGDGDKTCEECPAGTYSAEGSISCTPCEAGLFAGPGSAECAPCSAKTDMVIQLDGSGSLTKQFWSNQIDFVKDFVSNFDVSEDKTRLSVLQYNYKVTTEIDDFSMTDESRIAYTFNKMRFQRIACKTCSRIGSGYKTASELFQSSSRANAKKVLVAFTDGFTRGAGESDLAPAMKALEEQGVKVFFILVHKYGERALQGKRMTDFTTDAQNGFITNNWENLDTVAEQVQNAVCV